MVGYVCLWLVVDVVARFMYYYLLRLGLLVCLRLLAVVWVDFAVAGFGYLRGLLCACVWVLAGLLLGLFGFGHACVAKGCFIVLHSDWFERCFGGFRVVCCLLFSVALLVVCYGVNVCMLCVNNVVYLHVMVCVT